MLQVIRDRATGWFAWVIVILLVIPFALWGIQEYFGGGGERNIARVNDVEINKYDFYTRVDRERSRLGRPIEDAQEQMFKESVLERMIQEELLVQTAMAQGYRISDALLVSTIHAMSAFQPDGKFDEGYFKTVLKNNGLSVAAFEYIQKREMLLKQFISGISASDFVTPHELDQLLRLEEQQREFSYLQLPASSLASSVTVTDEEIAAHYKQYRDQYMTQEQVKLEYIVLDMRDIESTIEVSEAQLKSLYEEHNSGMEGSEQRKAAHILVEVDADASDEQVEKARAKIEELRARIQAGEDFATLAKEFSEDAGSAAQGGNLGVVEKGTLDPDFEDALYKLGQGEVSEPVRSAFGFHLVKLLSIEGAKPRTFAEMRDELEEQYRIQEAEPLFYDRLGLLTDLAYENPQTLEVAANELDLKIQQSGWISRSGGGEGLLADPKITAAAFSEDTFAGGNPAQSINSQVLELSQKDSTRLAPAVVVRLKEYRPSVQRSLEEVRAEISDTLYKSALRKKVQQEGSALLATLREQKDIRKLAQEHDLNLIEVGAVSRNDTAHDTAIINAVFKLKRPQDGSPEFSGFTLPSGDYVLIALTDVKAGDKDKGKDETRKFLARFIQNMNSSTELEGLVRNIRKNSEVVVFRDRINQASEN